MGVNVVGVGETALALFIQISIPPNSFMQEFIALSTASSFRISQTIGSAFPPAASISLLAV